MARLAVNGSQSVDRGKLSRALASKPQIEMEIRDEIEWLVNEYAKAIAIHKIKASQSFVDVFIIYP